MSKYIIKNVLNNNVILVEKKNKSYILVGKGIGFGKKKGTILENPEGIEKRFISLVGLNDYEYENFLASIDPKIIEVGQKIIEMVSNKLGSELNPKIHVGLIDHLNFLIKRLQEGVEIVNPFLLETKLLYPEEYELAEEALRILEDCLEMKVPETEIGFLTLHIYGGREDRSKEEALRSSQMIRQIIKYIEGKLKIQMSPESFDYKRFIMHLKGVIERVSEGKCIENQLLPDLREQLRLEFKIAYDISKMMERTLRVDVSESEVGYIALHLHRLRSHQR